MDEWMLLLLCLYLTWNDCPVLNSACTFSLATDHPESLLSLALTLGNFWRVTSPSPSLSPFSSSSPSLSPSPFLFPFPPSPPPLLFQAYILNSLLLMALGDIKRLIKYETDICIIHSHAIFALSIHFSLIHTSITSHLCGI